MKYFTVPLINKRSRGLKTFILGQSAEQKHYRAQHVSEDITLLWLEASQFGKLHCFPCVLKEHDGMLVFQHASSKKVAESNAMLIQRWNLFVNPENIQTDYHVEEMNRKEFYALFNDCQRKALEEDYGKPAEQPDPSVSSTPEEAPPAPAEDEESPSAQ